MRKICLRGCYAVFAMAMLLTSPLPCWADETSDDNMMQIDISGMIIFNGSQISYREEEDGTVSIVGCGSDMTGEVAIPAEISGKPVTKIAEGAFYCVSGLEAVTLPESITELEAGAFYGCTGLTELAIPAGVTAIGESAFYGCTGLSAMKLPDAITEIPESCFAGCTALETIHFPNALTTIGMEAFYGVKGLQTLEIPEGVTTIGDRAFYYWATLKQVTLPASLESLGSYVFDGCDALTEIHVREGNSSYCDQNGVLFDAEMTTLLKYPASKAETTYTIPAGVTKLESWSFIGATHLTEIQLGDVQSIGEDTFYYCTALTGISLPETLSEIPSGAFAYCSALRTMQIPRDCDVIGAYAFMACDALHEITIPSHVKQIGEYALGYGYDVETQSMTIQTNFQMRVSMGSEAAKYARENDLNYRMDRDILWFLLIGVAAGVVIIVAVRLLLRRGKSKTSPKGGKA